MLRRGRARLVSNSITRKWVHAVYQRQPLQKESEEQERELKKIFIVVVVVYTYVCKSV